MKNKKITMFGICLNIVIAIGILMIGGTTYFLSYEFMKEASAQLLMVFSAGFLLCYIFSYCYMLTHSIETHVIGDILYETKFIKWIQKNMLTAAFFISCATILLWFPIVIFCFYNLWITYSDLIVVVWVIAWIAFMRAADYAEQKTEITGDSQQHDGIYVYALFVLLFLFFGYDLILLFIEIMKNDFAVSRITVTSQILKELMLSTFGMLFIMIAGCLYYRHEKKIKIILEHMQLEHQIQQGELYIQLLSVRYHALQQQQHDYKKHLSYIQKLAQNNETRQIEDYISEVYDNLGDYKLLQLTGNQSLDLILSEKMYQANSKGIHFYVDYQLLKSMITVSAPDLSVILGNICDNAIQAAEYSIKKEITISFYSYNPYYCMIELKNSCDCAPMMRDNIPISDYVSEKHGYGVKNVISTAKKYGGECTFVYYEFEKMFVVKLLLPCENK